MHTNHTELRTKKNVFFKRFHVERISNIMVMVLMKQFTKLQCFGAGLLSHTYFFIKQIHRGNECPGLKQSMQNSVTKCGNHSLVLFTWVPKEFGFTQVCLGQLKCCFIRGLKGYTFYPWETTEAERHQETQ